MQTPRKFLVQLLDNLALLVAQVHRQARIVGYQRHALPVKAADPAMRRQIRRQAAARAGGHLRQQPRPPLQLRMKRGDV